MTSLKDIQSLIADIDSILPKADARLPWSKPGNVTRERRILERVRSYLVSQQQRLIAADKELPLATTPVQHEVVQQITQAVNRELNYLRTNFMQPLQADVEALRQQREALIQDIRQLEQKRQQIDSFNPPKWQEQQFISEFSQGLINRYTETLRQQLAQILANFQASVVNAELQQRSHDAAHTHSAMASLFPDHESVEGMMQAQVTSEQLRQLQEKSDQMLLTLEANQRTIFEALQRELQAYQASLSQGLEKMHSLGVQGEILFTALVNRTLEELRQQASTSVSTSVPLSEAANPMQEALSRSTPPETVLPSNIPTLTGRSLQTPLPPPQTVETGSIPPESAGEDDIYSILTDEQQMSPNIDRDVDSSGFEPFELSPEDNVLENLNSKDWEIIEGLDSENLVFELDDNEEIDTFIQLDINEHSPHPSIEAGESQSSSDSQELDFLLSWLNEKQQNASDPQVGKVTELGKSEVAAELTESVDRHRQEIDELYQSLFGTDSLSDTTNLKESDFPREGESDASQPMQTSENLQILSDDNRTNADSVEPLPVQVENALFEGLADPASVPSQEQPLNDLLFEDSLPLSSQPTDLAQEASSTSDSHANGIETITALTDLFETLGLTLPAPTTEDNPIPTSTTQPSETQASDTDSEVTLVEDIYIPASPEEDLLETATIESSPNLDILLDPNILHQFEQDLSSFEQYPDENVLRQQAQWWPSTYREESTVTPITEQSYQQNQQFPRSQELLAEDWEEFVLNQLREQQEGTDTSIPTAAESVESDFEPDLFPSEVLELDQESTVNAGAATSEERALPGELIAFEDENVVDEMQWDEPMDSTTEETIASPELEFDSDYSQAILDSERPGEDSTAISDALREEVQDEASEPTPDSTLSQDFTNTSPPDRFLQGEESQVPPFPGTEGEDMAGLGQPYPHSIDQDSIVHESDTLAESDVSSEQQLSESVEHSAPENEVVTESEPVGPSQSQIQEAHASEESNFDVNFPQSEVLNSQQPDNPNQLNS